MLLCVFVFFSTALNDPSGLAVQVRHLVEIREHHIVCKWGYRKLLQTCFVAMVTVALNKILGRRNKNLRCGTY